MWFGVIHHDANEQERILPQRVGARSSFLHGPLTEERNKGWLEPGSPAHVALRDIVRDKRLVKKISYNLNCRFVLASKYTCLHTCNHFVFGNECIHLIHLIIIYG